jgi:DNA modification methylase
LPESSIDCCITSVPYFNVRDYGVQRQIGLESDVDSWVEAMRPVFRELARVLKESGTAWINVDDTYSSSRTLGVPPKGMFLAPERLILALAADGWIVRSKVVWAKPNPLPRPLSDRPNHSYEPFFLIARSPKYRFDLDAIRIPYLKSDTTWEKVPWSVDQSLDGSPGLYLGRDLGDVWTIPAKGFAGGHFATYPEALVEKPILSSCPERICVACDRHWSRSSDQHIVGHRVAGPASGHVARFGGRWRTYRTRGPLRPSCACKAAWKPGIVLDPFFGAGTTAVVAERLRRDWIGIELNPRYARIADERIEAARSTSAMASERRTAA